MSVTRFWMRFAVAPLTFLIAFMLVIHAQPYNDESLRALLIAPDCENPCFMGIRPGVTNSDEGVALLRANAWVGTVSVYPTKLPAAYGSNRGALWTWSGKQPAWIDSSQPGILTFDGSSISNIRVQSTIRLGEIRLALGEPGSQRTSNTQSPAGLRFLSYAAIYPEKRLWISIGAPCPVRQPFDAFHQPVFLQWFENTRVSFSPSSAWPEVYGNC